MAHDPKDDAALIVESLGALDPLPPVQEWVDWLDACMEDGSRKEVRSPLERRLDV